RLGEPLEECGAEGVYDGGSDCAVERRRHGCDLRSAFERRIWCFQRGRLPCGVSVAGSKGRVDPDCELTYSGSMNLKAGFFYGGCFSAAPRLPSNPSPSP